MINGPYGELWIADLMNNGSYDFMNSDPLLALWLANLRV